MRPSRRIPTLALVVALAASWSPHATAQSVTDTALAETLYRQGRELAAAGNYDEACPKFAESYRLDPATGTLLNLASCHESQGKIATAWLEYSDALAAARRDRRQSRIDFAEQRIALLEPKLSRLTVLVPPGADDPGLELWIDGTPVGRAARGVPTPVDPGPHVVSAKAPGKKDWQASIEIAPIADQKTVTVPALESAPAAPVAAPVAAAAATPEPVKPPPSAHDELTTRPTPTSVYVAGGATLALAAAAVTTGALYLDQRDAYNAQPDGAKVQSDYDSARALGIVNVALWIATAAGAGLTGYLYFSRPERPATAHVSVMPFATADAAGLAASGRF